MIITAVVPAYNEKTTIAGVLRVLKRSRLLSETIVVDDGSTDGTARIAKSEGARVVKQKNGGKASAMHAGAINARGEYLLFCDADLVGLQPEHVSLLVDPVRAGGAAMTIGLRDHGPFWNLLMRTVLPKIGGERCIAKKDFLAASEGASGFGIESALNFYCKKNGRPVALVALPGVRHTIKEKKYGIARGIAARIAMIGEVVWAEVKNRY